jgi:hypothetical protein
MGFEDEAASRGFEFDAKDAGCGVMPERHNEEKQKQVSHGFQSTWLFSAAVQFSPTPPNFPLRLNCSQKINH